MAKQCPGQRFHLLVLDQQGVNKVQKKYRNKQYTFYSLEKFLTGSFRDGSTVMIVNSLLSEYGREPFHSTVAFAMQFSVVPSVLCNQYCTSSIVHPVLNIQYFTSSVVHPVLYIQYCIFSIVHPVLYIQWFISRIVHPALYIQYCTSNIVNPILLTKKTHFLSEILSCQ